MRRTRRLGALGLAVLTAAVVLAVVPAAPAGADHVPAPEGQLAGTGNFEGTETVLDNTYVPPACFQVTRSVFGLGGVGTYHGTTGGSEVVYRAQTPNPGDPVRDGPLRLEVENQTPYYHGPYGTNGADSTCSPTTAGTPIAADFRIFVPDHVYRLDGANTQVPCVGQGSFVRKRIPGDNGQPRDDWHADWTLTEACTVVGNDAGTPGQGVAPAGTQHTQHGFHGPCGDVCPNNIQSDYAQYHPLQGFHLGLGGPAAALVNDTVAVSARVTNDGISVQGAAVTFSVTGPGAAAPPAGAGSTDAEGRTSFSFTAVVAGDYTVTASATSATFLGQVATATRTVRFDARVPTMTLSPLATAQTEEGIVVAARVTQRGGTTAGASNEGHAGVVVNFAVSGPGQATPASGTAVTDAGGNTSFTFRVDRAGDYTVTASANDAGQEVSDTKVVHPKINTLKQAAAIALPSGEDKLRAAVVDPGGRYAYLAAAQKVVKVDLATFQRVGSITLSAPAVTGLVDPAGRYAYFASAANGTGRAAKVDLTTFQEVGAVTFPFPGNLMSAAMDPAGRFAYFSGGPTSSPGAVARVDLASSQPAGTITLDSGELEPRAMVIDPVGRFAYVATAGAGQKVVKVDLANFTRAVAADVSSNGSIVSAVIDPAGRYAYFGTGNQQVVKVDLAGLQQVGAVTVPAAQSLISAVIDPAGRYAYFGSETGQRVVRIDLRTFEVAHTLVLDITSDSPLSSQALTSVVIDPAGSHAYFGTTPGGPLAGRSGGPPTKVVKVALTRSPMAWLVAGADSYATPYATPLSVPAPGVLTNDADTEDNDPLTATPVDDPAHGSVTLDPDGSFTYTPASGFSGTDTFTYKADDGMDYSAPATVSVAVAPRPEGVAEVSGGAFGFMTNVSLFGAPPSVKGGPGSTCGQSGNPACADGQSPAVALAPNGGDLSATDPDGNVGQYGPARIFESHGPLTVRTTGATGPSGSVTSSSSVRNIQDNDPFHAGEPDGEASSTCTATRTGLSASTRIVNGRFVTSTDPSTGDPTSEVTFPHIWAPAPNTAYDGTLDHIGDRYRVVFNEQVPGTDSVTVNAVHLYLLGPTAVGDMIIGQSRCALVTDGPKPTTVSVNDTSVGETNAGTTNATFTLTRTGDTAGASSVKYRTASGSATAPGDYTAIPLTTATFAPGEVSKPVNVAVAGDTTVEANETFSVVLSSPTGAVLGDASGRGTILNDDAPPALAVNDVSVREGDAGATTAALFTVSRTGNTSGASTVKYRTTAGTATAGADFAALPLTTLSFAAGQTSKTVSVDVTGDAVAEADETFTLVLSAPTLAVIADASGTATIVNDDAPTYVAVNDVTTTEGNAGTTAATFTLSRSGNTAGASSVRYATADVTAAAGTDYTAKAPTTVTFAAGEVARTVTVDVTADTVDEANETLRLVLSAPVGATISDASGTATIVDDDGPITPGPATFVGINDVSVAEGNAGTTAAVFTITRSGTTAGTSTVRYATSGGTATAGADYTAKALTTVSFAPGQTTATVTVDVTGDTTAEANETLNLALSSPTSAVVSDASGTATIVNDDER